MAGMKVMVINPSGEETLGLLEEEMVKVNAVIEEFATKEAVLQLDEGSEPAPQVRVVDALPRRSWGYDCMVILGSPRGVLTSAPADAGDVQVPPDTIQQVEHLVREFHSMEKPVLGVCLGAQLIARAFGGEVKKLNRDAQHTALPGLSQPHGVEFGFHSQEFLESARDDKVISAALNAAKEVATSSQTGFDPKFCQWHSDCFEYPAGSIPLSTRASCPTQAFRMGRSTYAFQFHIEVGSELGQEWYKEYAEGTATHASCGAGPAGDDKTRKAVDVHLQSCLKDGSIAQCEAFTASVMRSMLEEAREKRLRILLRRTAVATVALAAALAGARALVRQRRA